MTKEIHGEQTAWAKLSKNIRKWLILSLFYAVFFSCSVTYRYSIEYIPIILLILFLFFEKVYQKHNGGMVVLNCGLPLNTREAIFGPIFFLILSITQIISSQIGVSKGLFPTHTSMIFVFSIYNLLSNLQNIELKLKGISLVYRFLKWEDIKQYHLQPLTPKKAGHIIFQAKKVFPLTPEYRSIEVSEKHWHNVCELLEQYLPNKRV